jgi:hypothetical protein
VHSRLMAELHQAGKERPRSRAEVTPMSVDFIVGLKGLDAGAHSRSSETPFHGESLRIIGVETSSR